MDLIVNRIRNNKVFLKQIGTLVSGTLITQFILFISTPLLTKLYSPEDFGTLAIFTTIATILSIVFNQKVDLAIIVPDKEEDAVSIVFLGLMLSCISVILLSTLNLLIKDEQLFFHLQIYFQAFLFAVNSIFMFVLHRRLKYKWVSVFLIIQTISQLIVNVGLGYLGYRNGLIYGLFVGYIFSNIGMLIYLNIKSETKIGTEFSGRLIEIYKQYKVFPLYQMPQQLFQLFGQQSIIMLLDFMFNKNVVGLYSVSNRILKVPFITFVGSVGNVFKNNAKQEYLTNRMQLKSLYKKTFIQLLVIGLLLYGGIYFFIDFFFNIFLGNKWIEGTEYAKIIGIGLIWDIIEAPLSFIFTLLGKQKVQLLLQILLFVSQITFFGISFFLKLDSISIVFIYTLINAVFAILSITFSYNYVCKLNIINQ